MSRRIKIQLAVLVAALGVAGTALAEDVIEKSSSGEVNWTKGIIYAKGYGTAKEGLSAPQKRLLSRRAAVVDGQRNLLELTKGVRLTSMTKVVDQIVEGSTTATRVQGGDSRRRSRRGALSERHLYGDARNAHWW